MGTTENDKMLNLVIPVEYQFESEFKNLQNSSPISICRMRSPFYSGEKWAIRTSGLCLNKNGEWEYETIPSKRDGVFYKRCRFDSLAESIEAVLAQKDR